MNKNEAQNKNSILPPPKGLKNVNAFIGNVQEEHNIMVCSQ